MDHLVWCVHDLPKTVDPQAKAPTNFGVEGHDLCMYFDDRDASVIELEGPSGGVR